MGDFVTPPANRLRALPKPLPVKTMHPAVQDMMWQAALGSLAATEDSLPALYLAAARHLIAEAQRMARLDAAIAPQHRWLEPL